MECHCNEFWCHCTVTDVTNTLEIVSRLRLKTPQRLGAWIRPSVLVERAVRTYSDRAYRKIQSDVRHVHYFSENFEGDFRTP